MNNELRYELVFIIGAKGTGKSTFAANLVQQKLKENPGFGLTVIDRNYHDPPRRFPVPDFIGQAGKFVRYPAMAEQDMQRLLVPPMRGQGVTKSVVVIDDCLGNMTTPTGELFKELGRQLRKHKLFVFVTMHGVSEMKPAYFQHADKVHFFQVREPWGTVQNKLRGVISREHWERVRNLPKFTHHTIDLRAK